jgi:hypothetical protein
MILGKRVPVWAFPQFDFNTQRLAAHPLIPAKAGIQKKADWMPDQARHNETTLIQRCLRRCGFFTGEGLSPHPDPRTLNPNTLTPATDL